MGGVQRRCGFVTVALGGSIGCLDRTMFASGECCLCTSKLCVGLPGQQNQRGQDEEAERRGEEDRSLIN